jgi:hypothetical protein
VEGNLDLVGSARFQGLALVGGDLAVQDDAVLEGLVRVGGALSITGGARLEASACPVLRALSGLPALRRPFLLPGSGPLTAF